MWGERKAEGTMTLIERLKAGMYDVPQSTAELLQEAIDALQKTPEYREAECCFGPDRSIGERMP